MANGVVNRNDGKEGKEIEFESKIGISMEREREREGERRGAFREATLSCPAEMAPEED